MARKPTPIADAFVDRLTENRPLAGAIIAGVRAAADRTTTEVSRNDVPAIMETVGAAVARDPAAVNSANMERRRESRVVMGTATSTFMALSTFFTGLGALTGAIGGIQLTGPAYWIAVATTVLGGLGGGANIFALFGRLKADLPPMHFRPWNPLSWLARRKEDVEADPTG